MLRLSLLNCMRKIKEIPEDPAFSTGLDQFSNSNRFVLDRLVA
jgi:hypothetical protein